MVRLSIMVTSAAERGAKLYKKKSPEDPIWMRKLVFGIVVFVICGSVTTVLTPPQCLCGVEEEEGKKKKTSTQKQL